MAAYFHQVPVGHVEAGLRTGNIYDPFPEEMNRRLAGKLCTLHFAPTEQARSNLLAEGTVPDTIYLTGNTATDAVRWAAEHAACADEGDPLCTIDGGPAELPTGLRWIVVTAHRRENIPDRLERICVALRRLCARGDVAVIFAVHPNPAVREIVRPVLGDVDTAVLIEPPDYAQFARLLAQSAIVITDSGGIQEEAPSLGKPVLVVRETTERPEGVAAGVAKLVGTDTETIVMEATRLLDDESAYASMVHRASPYGDGRCSDRILDATLHHFGLGPRPADIASEG
jgi:UDP-N-acetylglucosamine 2-epimerase